MEMVNIPSEDDMMKAAHKGIIKKLKDVDTDMLG